MLRSSRSRRTSRRSPKSGETSSVATGARTMTNIDGACCGDFRPHTRAWESRDSVSWTCVETEHRGARVGQRAAPPRSRRAVLLRPSRRSVVSAGGPRQLTDRLKLPTFPSSYIARRFDINISQHNIFSSTCSHRVCDSARAPLRPQRGRDYQVGRTRDRKMSRARLPPQGIQVPLHL